MTTNIKQVEIDNTPTYIGFQCEGYYASFYGEQGYVNVYLTMDGHLVLERENRFWYKESYEWVNLHRNKDAKRGRRSVSKLRRKDLVFSDKNELPF